MAEGTAPDRVESNLIWTSLTQDGRYGREWRGMPGGGSTRHWAGGHPTVVSNEPQLQTRARLCRLDSGSTFRHKLPITAVRECFC